MNGAGESSSSLKCSQCDRQFSTQRSLRCHVKIHNERTLKCCFCESKFNRTDALFLHALDHLTDGKIKCYSDNCEEEVDTLFEGEKHAFIVHSQGGATVLKCKECSEVTPNFRKMLYHYTFKHGQLKQFAEEMIQQQKEFLKQKKNEQRKEKRTAEEMERGDGGGFEDQLQAVMGDGENTDEIINKLSDLVAEMFPLDGGQEFYQCTHCMLGFSDAILWMIHLGFHDVDEPFKCTGCGRKFENRQTFVIHLTYFAHGAIEEIGEK